MRKSNLTAYLAVFLLLTGTVSGEENEAQIFLRIFESGIKLTHSESMWVDESKHGKIIRAIDSGKIIQSYSDKVKDMFSKKYPDRQIIRIDVVQEVTTSPPKFEIKLKLIQFKIFFKLKNTINIGIPACVGYLIREDGETIEQGIALTP